MIGEPGRSRPFAKVNSQSGFGAWLAGRGDNKGQVLFRHRVDGRHELRRHGDVNVIRSMGAGDADPGLAVFLIDVDVLRSETHNLAPARDSFQSKLEYQPLLRAVRPISPELRNLRIVP